MLPDWSQRKRGESLPSQAHWIVDWSHLLLRALTATSHELLLRQTNPQQNYEGADSSMIHVQDSLAFMIIAGFIDCFGFLGNTLILCYLFFNRVGSKLTTTLMKNQLAFDGLISDSHYVLSL
ncbi:hypothetical protein FGIG_03476 [Fasciola gigantica]|uniref:Uncharacterized protein n=1 Tax=Fasciola gigantica TaxID=46835 RepID=A0A504YTY1_FASGI|nr:hypothetical protein FGIG_03476 [Fasciola gigantica]